MTETETIRPFASCGFGNERRTCMLMVTHGCNLNCIYCYEKYKNAQKKMSVDMAKEIIQKEIDFVKNSKDFSELEIDFMGGEPLLRFDLIKEIVEWLENGACDIPFICFATTNGTLLTPEMKKWFSQHKRHVVLGASYDGMSGHQGKNRGEKAESIDLDYFIETWPYQGFKMTISKGSLRHLYDSCVYMHSKGYVFEASLAQGEDWNNDDATTFFDQLTRLADYYHKHPDIYPCNLLTRSLQGIGERSETQMKYCGSGYGMMTYDVDGTAYGCHMFTPLVLGNRAVKFNDFSGWCDEEALTDETCKGCGLSRWCSTCIGFNMLTRGKINRRDHRWCAMNAAQAQAACQFQLTYFNELLKRGENLKLQEAQALQSAVSAYEYLNSIDYTQKFPQ